ncbi:MAG: hypothetical protein IT239_00395 [Bacteroidia bacterium]|nr:hypothetical protein [Bacteroidia bacterium]
MKYKNHIITLFFTFCSFYSFAQNSPTISLDETIKFINAKLGSQIVFDLKNGDIIIKYYDDKNRLFRIDKADTEDLDWSRISYADEDMLFVIPCHEEDGKCIDRKYPIKKEEGLYARMTFKIQNVSDFESLKKAVTHLLRSIEEFDYRSNESFEK